MREDVAAALAVEIEIGVVGQVDYCRSIAAGGQGESQVVLLAPFIAGHCLQCSRVAHLPVLGIVKELNGIPVDSALPDLVLKALRTAVKMVRTVVHGQGVLLAVKGEFAQGNPVGISSRHFSRARAVSEITHRVRVAQNHVGEVPLPVRDADGNDSRSHA